MIIPVNCFWTPGLWNLADLQAVESAVHIIEQGIAVLGGNYYNLITTPITMTPHYGRAGAERWYINYDLGGDDAEYDNRQVIHEMGHIINFASGDLAAKKFMHDLGAKCSTFVNMPATPDPSIHDPNFKNPMSGIEVPNDSVSCNEKFNKDDRYDPGFDAGYDAGGIAVNLPAGSPMPSPYSFAGAAEDFAETFAAVISEAYVNSPGDGVYLSNATNVYNFYNHDLGMRRLVMQQIISGNMSIVP